MLTHRNVAENATCLDMKIPERIVIMTVLPIHHAYCLSMDILKGVSLAAVICINDSSCGWRRTLSSLSRR